MKEENLHKSLEVKVSQGNIGTIIEDDKNHYKLEPADSELFATYHAVYSNEEFDLCFAWDEQLAELRSCKNCYFLYRNSKCIGGLTIDSDSISNPFLIQPFSDRVLFWNIILKQLKMHIQENKIHISQLRQVDADVLISLGASKKWSQQRMYRPTDILEIETGFSYDLVCPAENDIPEIVQVVYQAHVHDITARTYGEPVVSDVEKAILRRFDAFSQTNTLHFGKVAKEKATQKIIGVCIAGIYPASPYNFSTIHQVSVLPAYRRQGIAENMMRAAISTAHSISPVIGLGVLAGNPAENLYQKLGFTPRPSFTYLTMHL
jgi:ribosomal protein S18 acetylase RimI-like enzyme